MNKLPKKFELDRYGLHMRLVREEDAEFIVNVRTDSQNARFIHDTDANVSKQQEWIREYKKREALGEDYYFIYFQDNSPIGLYRLYNIHDGIFTTGSWVFDKSCEKDKPILSAIIGIEIAFDDMGLVKEESNDGCHVANTKINKINRLLGYKETGRIYDVKGEYITYSLTKEDFLEARNRILKLLGY